MIHHSWWRIHNPSAIFTTEGSYKLLFQFSAIWFPIFTYLAIHSQGNCNYVKCTCSSCFHLQTANTPSITHLYFSYYLNSNMSRDSLMWTSAPFHWYYSIYHQGGNWLLVPSKLSSRRWKKWEICSPALKSSLYLLSTEILLKPNVCSKKQYVVWNKYAYNGS